MATFNTTFIQMQRVSEMLAPAPAPPPVQYQDGWRCCQKCSGLFYGFRLQRDPDEGHCAAGDKHDSTNSKDYMVPFSDAGPGMQMGWRYCQKCQGLFYSDHPTQGACPCGGQHDHANRSLSYDMFLEGPPGMETGWRWCAKCEGLFNSGNEQSACPTGGKHDGSGSGAYAMKLGALPSAPARKLKPQLFLVETYQISTFHGGLIRGDMVGTLPAMTPHTHMTSKLIINKMTSSDIAQSSTVMDDQTAQSSQSFNQQAQDSSDSKSSSEHYNYGFQANAHAEGSVGFGSASGDAHVDAAGSTNDAREDIAQSIGHAIDSQVNQANQVRKQQVTVGSSETKIDETTQTEVDIERANDSDQVLNLGVFQLKQELITILSLVDVQVAFRNTDSHNDKMVKLFELDSLLEEVIAAAKDRAVIKSQIKTALENIRDYMDESKSILVQDPTQPDTLVVNKRLTSAYELKNRDGTTRKVISVPGIIASDYSPRFIYQRGAYMTLPITL
jgi:hypothetical protein